MGIQKRKFWIKYFVTVKKYELIKLCLLLNVNTIN